MATPADTPVNESLPNPEVREEDTSIIWSPTSLTDSTIDTVVDCVLSPTTSLEDQKGDERRVIDIISSKAWFRMSGPGSNKKSKKSIVRLRQTSDLGGPGKDDLKKTKSKSEKMKKKKVAGLLRDMQNDGEIDEADLIDAIERLIRHERDVSQLKWIIAALAVFAMFVCAVMTGLTYAIVILASDTRVDSSGAYVSRDTGTTVRTSAGFVQVTMLPFDNTSGAQGSSRRRSMLGVDETIDDGSGKFTTQPSPYITMLAADRQSEVVLLSTGTIAWQGVADGCRIFNEGHTSFAASIAGDTDSAEIVSGVMRWVHVSGCDKPGSNNPVSVMLSLQNRIFKWVCSAPPEPCVAFEVFVIAQETAPVYTNSNTAPINAGVDGPGVTAPLRNATVDGNAVSMLINDTISVLCSMSVADPLTSFHPAEFAYSEGSGVGVTGITKDLPEIDTAGPVSGPLIVAVANRVPRGSYLKPSAGIALASTVDTLQSPGSGATLYVINRGAMDTILEYETLLLGTRGQMGQEFVDGAFTVQPILSRSDGSQNEKHGEAKDASSMLSKGLGVLTESVSLPNRFLQRSVPKEFAQTHLCTNVACTSVATVAEGGHPLFCSNLAEMVMGLPCKGFVIADGLLRL